MTRPTVSIIVPVYNAAKYLPECLESILRQTFTDIEVLLVNDGSKDNSLAICNKYAAKDARIRVIDIPNGGVSNARNTGLSYATGTYIQFADSDDILCADMTQTLVCEMECERADLAVCSFETVVRKGRREISRSKTTRPYFGERFVLEMPELSTRLAALFVRVGGMECVWNKLYSRAIIEENVVRFAVEFSYGEDHMFNVAYFRHCEKMVYLDRPLYQYMQWGGTLSRRCPANIYENQLRLADALCRLVEERGALSEESRVELEEYRSNVLWEVMDLVCSENNGLNGQQKQAQLQLLLDDEGFLTAYRKMSGAYFFADRLDVCVENRDAAGVLAVFEDVRAQLRRQAKHPVASFLLRQLRAYSEKHPGTSAGKAAQILYLNLATTGFGETLKRILHRFAK